MSTERNLTWPLPLLGEKGSMMSIPYLENGQGANTLCNS